MKELKNLLENIEILELIGNENQKVNGFQFDSRKIELNDIFIAQKGVLVNGHNYIEKAINLGAKTIICEVLPETFMVNVTYVLVKNSDYALGILANNFYENPSKKINLIGITGTNGKTTTTTLLYELFKKLGKSCALISTIKIIVNNKEVKSSHTTPDSITIHKTIADAVSEGCEYVFMEVSSHGIDQNRIAGLDFNIALFSNITHDHLDYHKTFENYLYTKKRFFDLLPSSATAITNIDDKNGLVILQNTKAKKITYGLKKLCNYKGKIIESGFLGMELGFNEKNFWTPLIGEFNAYNLLAAFSVASESGFNELEILIKLSELKNVSGRFETFTSKSGITSIIDYAHTPDALENVLKTIGQIKRKDQNIVTVFGCGGNRDVFKRPKMGEIAAKYSNQIIITNDNPRDEDSEEITNQIKKGIPANFERNTLVISNRKEAIKTAYKLLLPGDIVLIAGKGHETYQEIKGKRFDFDDLKIAQSITNELNL